MCVHVRVCLCVCVYLNSLGGFGCVSHTKFFDLFPRYIFSEFYGAATI